MKFIQLSILATMAMTLTSGYRVPITSDDEEHMLGEDEDTWAPSEHTPGTGPVDWEQNVYDVEEYFKDIPDLINMTTTTFRFQMIHWYLTGFERGMYNDSSIRLDSDCFGGYYVTKLNEYEYLFQENPFGNIWENYFPEISLTYQFFYMFNNQCDVDETVYDFMIFCWYRGCWPKQMVKQAGSKWLYVLRSINDAAIVWYEGIPEGQVTEEDLTKWNELGEQTGLTTAEIIQDITGFYVVPVDERY